MTDKTIETKSSEQMLEIANQIASKHGLKAEFIPGVSRVGVGGDNRTYGPVITLVGPPILQDVLAEVSTKITNDTGLLVTYDITLLKQQLDEQRSGSVPAPQ